MGVPSAGARGCNVRERSPNAPMWRSASHINENDNDISISLDVPGIKVSDLTVNVEDRILTVSGHRAINHGSPESKNRSWKFLRQFAVDTSAVDVSKLSANLNNGVLTISVPKVAQKKSEPITIAISEESPSAATTSDNVPSVGADDVTTTTSNANKEAADDGAGTDEVAFEETMTAHDEELDEDVVLVEATNEEESLEDDSDTNVTDKM